MLLLLLWFSGRLSITESHLESSVHYSVRGLWFEVGWLASLGFDHPTLMAKRSWRFLVTLVYMMHMHASMIREMSDHLFPISSAYAQVAYSL